MFGNYLTSALRALKRDRFHAVLNVMGLAVALATCFLIALYVRYEFSYDRYFSDPDQLYRMETAVQPPGRDTYLSAYTPYALIDKMNADFSTELETTGYSPRMMTVAHGETQLRRVGYFARANLFDVLDFPVLHGDAAAALATPATIILTERLAHQLFGTDDVVGRDLRLEGQEVRVGAVLRDLPNTSTFTFDIIQSDKSPALQFGDWQKTSWNFSSYQTFIRLKDGVAIRDIDRQMPAFAARSIPASEQGPSGHEFQSRPLTGLHLTAGTGNRPSNRNMVSVTAFAAVGIVLLLIACFNYINLATARALLRTREVGMRKILGASNRQLFIQFLGETLAVTLAAFLIAFGLALLALPAFATLIGRDLQIAGLMTPGFVIFAIVMLGLLSLAAGIYPGLVLANFRSTQLFGAQRAAGGRGGFLRHGMVAMQFVLTVVLLVSAAVVFTQVSFLKHIDLGFEKDDLMLVRTTFGASSDPRGETLKRELARDGHFTLVGGSQFTPVGEAEIVGTLSRAADGSTDGAAVSFLHVDAGFFPVYGLAPEAGRLFSPDMASDATRPVMVLSRSAVRPLGFPSPEEAMGRPLYFGSGDSRKVFTVIGVVPDVKFFLGRRTTRPMAYQYDPAIADSISLRVRHGETAEALDRVQQIWGHVYPDQPMNYQFFEDVFTAANADDDRQSKLFTAFTALAIAVACLGLFGLASFAAARRTQEIAIRKVLGASTGRITGLLLWDFARPVLAANIIAWPLAWLLMRQWLNGFAYRVDMSPAFFIGASAVALVVALATVTGRTMRAARIRPAMALKYE